MLRDLTDTLAYALQKPSRPRSATIVRTSMGNVYKAGSVSSDSSLFDITSEHAALIQAIQRNDFTIDTVTTLTEESTMSPIAVKILKDYVARVGGTLSYHVMQPSGELLFETNDIASYMPEYVSPSPELQHLKQRSFVERDHANNSNPTLSELREYAKLGMQHHFLSVEEGSLYGCVIATANGSVYTGGAYGSPDKRLGLHAEIATLTQALADGARDISHIGIASTKYTDTPCPVCGHCRQVIAEVLDKIGGNPHIISFATDTDVHQSHTLAELLPHQWRSKKW